MASQLYAPDNQEPIALVTGAASGIGAAIALELLDGNAKVAIVDLRRDAESADLQGRFDRFGKNVLRIQADVSSFAEAQRAVQTTLETWGSLHILVNNAGINKDAVSWKMTEEQWDSVMDVNVKGCFNFCRFAVPILREQKGGRIVNISSINGLRGKFGQMNYAAAKAGIIGLSKTLAKELGKYGVTVNAVAPGNIATAMTATLSDEFQNAAIEESALKKTGRAEDVAALIAFLCSHRAGHITGEVIKVDGGQYI